MLITIGAIALLGGVILNVNRNIDNTGSILLHSNIGIEEVSLASSIMEEAQGLAFDEVTDTSVVSSTSQLTPASELGQENGDPADLDDFDDFNGLNNKGLLEIDTLSTGVYYVYTRVHYVDPNDVMANATTQTWDKRLDVWVWNSLSPDTVKMQTVFSYWPF
ncbi:MAG: hypothetical protein M1378_13825 [Bacteroidetes bacterium]|nr:hypothetical protein [Bacteroidota bacterium]